MASHEELGLTIREARLARSMSLGQLASAVGRSSSSVRRWERGEVAPAASVLPKLAAILEIDPRMLEHEATDRISDEASVATELADTDGRVSTIEQPVVSEQPGQPVHADSATQQSEGGIFADAWQALTRGRQGWNGWIRGLLTAAFLIAMLFVLLWAVGELASALGAVLDSFDIGTNGNESP